LINFVGAHNIKEIWAISVGNALKAKHYVLLLQSNGHICSCLSIIRCGAVCRHYFQVMLATKDALFHIRLIQTRWYCTKKNSLEEPFLTADKFIHEDQNATYYHHNTIQYLGVFEQNNKDICDERLTVLEQRLLYGKLHGTYKKALSKALKVSSKSHHLINLLQEFVENDDSNEDSDLEDELQQDDDNISDKENLVPVLQNLKQHKGKGRPPGTKRFKSAQEVPKSKIKNQRHCKKCGDAGHYRKNCKVLLYFIFICLYYFMKFTYINHAFSLIAIRISLRNQ
jgi:hypothetical protein